MSTPNFKLPVLQGQKQQQQQVDLFSVDPMASPLQQPRVATQDEQQQQQLQVAGSKEIDQFFTSAPLPPNQTATTATAAVPDVFAGIEGAADKPKQRQRQRPPVPPSQRGGGGGGGGGGRGFLEPRPPSPLSSVSHPSAPMGFPVVKDWGDWNQDRKNSIRDFFLKQFTSLELGKEVHDCLPEILDYVIDRLPSFVATYFRDAYVLLCRRELQIVLHVMIHVFRKNQKGLSSQGTQQDQNKFDFLNNFVNFYKETDPRYYTAILFFLLLLRIMYNFMIIIRLDFGNNKYFKPEVTKSSTTKFSIQPVPMHTMKYYHLIIFTYCFLWAIENYHVIESHIAKQNLHDFIGQTTETITPKLLHQHFRIRQQVGGGGGGGGKGGGEGSGGQGSVAQQRGDSGCHSVRVSPNNRMTLYDYILIIGMYIHRIQFIHNDLFNLLVNPELVSGNPQLYEGVFGTPYVPITDDRFFDIPLVPYRHTVIFEKIEPKFKAYSSRRPQSQRQKRLKI